MRWWFILSLFVSVTANNVHEIVERVQMMQGKYHVLDALDTYTWYYEKLWEGDGFPGADDTSPHLTHVTGPSTTSDVFTLTRSRFRTQEEGDIYCTAHDDPNVCIGTRARGTALTPTRYYGIDIAAPVITSNQTFKLILGPRVYNVHAFWDLNSASGHVDVTGRLISLHLPDVGGTRLIFNTVTGEGTLYGAPQAFRNYLVGQSLYDIHLYRGGTCGDDASTTCPGALTDLNVPCTGHGRCEISCQCVCDKAPHEMIMEALVVGESAPNTPDGALTVEDNPLRTPYRGDGCEITCPGYNGFSMESVCSGRGTCGDRGQCICDYGYIGDNCQFTCPGFDGTEDSAELICSKKGSCEVTDISPTSFRSSDSRNKDRFLRVLREFYGRCHTFIADNQRNDATKFPDDACTADDECSSGFCNSGTCTGEQPPHMYVALDVDVNLTPEPAPADAKRYCSRVENCFGYVGNNIYVGDNVVVSAGNATIYVKDPFFSPYNLSRFMEGRESYLEPCRLPSQQVDERPWVYRPFIRTFVQKYDEPVEDQTWEGLLTRDGVTTVVDDKPPTLTATRTCELHPNFVLRCPSCLCFRSRVQGFFDGPMCEQCARGYATETCKTKCPGYDGKNLESACSGLGLCNMGKDGTGQCLCGGSGGSRSTAETGRVLPLYRDVDAPYGGATNDFCALWSLASTCEEHPGCVWNRRCLPKRSGGERAVPSPPLLPFEATYFVGQYREFSTFLWPQVTPDIILDFENWSNGEMSNSDGDVQCRDFPGVDCSPTHNIPFYYANTDTVALQRTVADMCPRDSVDVVELRTLLAYDSNVETYFRACCRCGGGQRGHGLPTSALKVASSYEPSCQDTWKNDCSTFTHCSNGRVDTTSALDWTSFRDRNGITPDIGCCACGGGEPTETPAECKAPVYERDVNQTCTSGVANAYNEAQCEAECSLDVSCFAYQWDGSTCAHSSSALENANNVPGTTCFRKENHERCAGWGCANAFGVDCTSCNNTGAREGCCACGGGVDSNAPVVPFRVRPNPRLTAQSYPVSVSEIERRTASKINFPFEFAGVAKIRQQRRLGTSVCPDCPDSDCNKCPNDCALCVNGYSGFNCGDLCGTCLLGGTCVSRPTDGVTLCDCPSSSSSDRHNCCPNGFVLLTNDQTLTRPNQIGGVAAGLATYGAFSSDADPRSVTYFDGDEDANLISGCYPCPGVTSSAEICMHPFCEDSLVDVPDRCRTENQYRVGYANLWRTVEPQSWNFKPMTACTTSGTSYTTFGAAETACNTCAGIQEDVTTHTYTLCSAVSNTYDRDKVVWEKTTLGTCVDAEVEDTAEMRHWRSVYAASSGYASNACNGHLDQCMVDFNVAGSVFEDRTVCGRCFSSEVDTTLAHGRDCQPCGYGEFGELPPDGETFSTTCQSCPAGRGMPGLVGVAQEYTASTSSCSSGVTDATTCTQDPSCPCYEVDGVTYTKNGFHRAPGYACASSNPDVIDCSSAGSYACYETNGTHCFGYSNFSIAEDIESTAFVNSFASGGPCQPCGVGRFSDTSSAMCETCGKGMYQDEVGASACKSCPYGWYTSKGSGDEGHDSLEDCTPCPAGTFSEERFMDDDSACKDCPDGEGTRSFETNFFTFTETKLTCAENDFEDYTQVGCQGIEGIDVTVLNETAMDYPPGCSFSFVDSKYYYNPANPDTYRVDSVAERAGAINLFFVICEPPKIRYYCASCPVGYYKYRTLFDWNVGTPTNDCAACPMGRYQDEVGTETCKRCSMGQFRDDFGFSSCKSCPAGWFHTDNRYECAQCEPGKFSGLGSQTCTLCPSGYFSDTFGSATCKGCLGGTYQASVGSRMCHDCAAGRYNIQEEQVACIACPSGYFATDVGNEECTKCPNVMYQDNIGQTQCILCPQGYSGNRPPAVDVDGTLYDPTLTCAQYSKSIVLEPQCEEYANANNLTYLHLDVGLENLPTEYDGATNITATNVSAEMLLLGSFAFAVGGCGVGGAYTLSGFPSIIYDAANQTVIYYDKSVDVSYWNNLDPGFVVSSMPVRLCGQMGPSTSVDGCAICPSTTYQDQLGQETCKTCPEGRFSASGSTSLASCTTCDVGKFYNGQQCETCPAGFYVESDIATSCDTCPIGQFSDPGSGALTDCGCTQSQRWTGTDCTACTGGRSRSLPSYHRSGRCVYPSNYAELGIGCWRDGNMQYSDHRSFTGTEASYDLNNWDCKHGGDGNTNSANDRIHAITFADVAYGQKLTFILYGDSNCNTFKSQFTIGCDSNNAFLQDYPDANRRFYFQDGASTYTTSRPSYDGSRFDASCLKVQRSSC